MNIIKRKQNIFLKKNSFLLLLFIVTVVNIVFFFYIKNSTHFLLKKVNNLSKEIATEERNLSVKQAEFNRSYSVQKLQELSNSKLKLHFSNVEQIVDFKELLLNKNI